MNVLILSVGTRNLLVGYFMNRDNGFDRVVVTDCSTYAPAIYIADQYYIVPKMTEAGYLEALMEICREENIKVIIPLQEDELLIISKNRALFETLGILIAISDFNIVRLCRDKFSTSEILLKNNIPAVITYRPEDYVFKTGDEIVVKPRSGAGSVNTLVIHDKRMMDAFILSAGEEMIIQPYLRGRELGVDVYIDFISREVVAVFVKEKVRMRAGETEKSVSVINMDITNIAINTAKCLGLMGPIDMDIMEVDGRYYILEINPRFGGGYPHAYLCGVNFIQMIARNAAGVSNNPVLNEYPENVKAMKYSDIMIR